MKYRTIRLLLSMLRKIFSGIVALVTGILGFLISLYPEQVKQIISSTVGTSDVAFVFNVLIFCIVLAFSGSILYILCLVYRKLKIDVLIQKESLRFNKYPYLVSLNQQVQNMPNMSYSEITVENRGKNKVNECEVEITLRKEGNDVYKSKVLSSDSTKEPNPMTISIDAHGRVGFHPICLRLDSFEVFLPNHSLGAGGSFTGTLVKHGEYEILGRTIFDGKSGKPTYLGKIKIPNDFLDKAKIPNDIQVIIDQGGFIVYAEFFEGKVRAKFYGHNNEEDIRRTLQYLEQIPKLDDVIEDNGTPIKRPSRTGINFLGSRQRY